MNERVLEYIGFREADLDEEHREFAEWLEEVDAICQEKVPLSIFDLPDFLWRSYHDDGTSPQVALEAFFEAEEMEEFL